MGSVSNDILRKENQRKTAGIPINSCTASLRRCSRPSKLKKTPNRPTRFPDSLSWKMFDQRFQELNIQELKVSQPTPSLKHGTGIEYPTEGRTQYMETISNVPPSRRKRLSRLHTPPVKYRDLVPVHALPIPIGRRGNGSHLAVAIGVYEDVEGAEAEGPLDCCVSNHPPKGERGRKEEELTLPW